MLIPPFSCMHLSLCCISASSLSSLVRQAGSSSGVVGGLAITWKWKDTMQIAKSSFLDKYRSEVSAQSIQSYLHLIPVAIVPGHHGLFGLANVLDLAGQTGHHIDNPGGLM